MKRTRLKFASALPLKNLIPQQVNNGNEAAKVLDLLLCKESRSKKTSAYCLLAKEITRRTGCERREFIWTSAGTGGQPAGEVFTTQTFPGQGYIECRLMGPHAGCVRSKCQLFTIRARRENSSSWLPVSPSTLTDGLPRAPTGREGDRSLERRPCSHIPHTYLKQASIFKTS